LGFPELGSGCACVVGGGGGGGVGLWGVAAGEAVAG